MKKIKKYIVILISILFIMAFYTKSVYAITCELSIKDDGNNNGFVEKDGQLYYVITISSKTFGGTVSSIKFKLCYDEEYLELLNIENGELDLAEKGKYDREPYIIEYEDWDAEYKKESNVFIGKNEDNDRTLMAINENEIDLIRICFKVKDNVQEKRLVYIDTQSDSTQILYAYPNQDKRYITNGVPMNENISDNPESNDNDSYDNKNENQQQGSQEQTQQYNNKENKAPNILPQTGVSITIILIIVLAVTISILLWIKLRKTKKYR